jgi:acylpyruvate hydrolase
MKLLTFERDGLRRLGAFQDGAVIDLNAASALAADSPPAAFGSLKALLAAGPEGLAWARAALAAAAGLAPAGRAGVVFAPEAVTWLAPVPDPQKIIAIGLNYKDHCVEQNLPEPTVMTVFCKFPSALIGPGAAILLPPPATCRQVDYEAELAVVIGCGGRDIPADQALAAVGGYTCCNDVSGRDVQYGDGGRQWVHGKSFDTFCPLGPWLVTADEIADPHTLDIALEVNGERLQASNTANLVFRVPYLIAELSKSLTLLPGDVITTGTPGGVGVFRQPQRFLAAGDEVVVRIAGIGELHNPVAG